MEYYRARILHFFVEFMFWDTQQEENWSSAMCRITGQISESTLTKRSKSQRDIHFTYATPRWVPPPGRSVTFRVWLRTCVSTRCGFGNSLTTNVRDLAPPATNGKSLERPALEASWLKEHLAPSHGRVQLCSQTRARGFMQNSTLGVFISPGSFTLCSGPWHGLQMRKDSHSFCRHMAGR